MIKITKNFRSCCLTFSLLWLSFSVTSVHAKTLVIASDVWCPYICDEHALPGFVVEIMNEIAKKNDLKLELAIIPLARALDLAHKNKVDILLALPSQSIANAKLQKSHASFGGLYNDFYISSELDWHFKGMDDLEAQLNNNIILGTVNGYEYGDKIAKLLRNNPDNVFSASGNSPLNKQLRMLQLGRLDILLDSRFTVQYHLSKLPNNTIVYAGTQGDLIPLFLGFSPSFSKELIQIFDQGQEELRQNGRLEQILEKYGITDWLEPLAQQNKNALNIISE